MGTTQLNGELYSNGVLLRDALLLFAPDELRREYLEAKDRDEARGEAEVRARAQELRFSSLPESTRTAIAAGLGIDLERLAIDAEYMRVLPGDAALRAAKTKHHVEYVPRLESSLLASIREGQFAALGYEGPRKLASRLVYIPSTDLRFFTDIDLYTSEIVCQALKFVEVRLVRAGTLDLEFKTATPVAAHSKGPRVVLAYERLLASGGVKPDDTPKAVKKAVAAALGGTVTEKTVWTHIGKLHLANQMMERGGGK